MHHRLLLTVDRGLHRSNIFKFLLDRKFCILQYIGNINNLHNTHYIKIAIQIDVAASKSSIFPGFFVLCYWDPILYLKAIGRSRSLRFAYV